MLLEERRHACEALSFTISAKALESYADFKHQPALINPRANTDRLRVVYVVPISILTKPTRTKHWSLSSTSQMQQNSQSDFEPFDFDLTDMLRIVS
ncbi:hypothetical protein L596_000511 [Steinernema carpocapsae]|uniref:Uncharacterized protein n=1 Tax=Steinernema carpocapsae TaxID=34508 RepID=A0A4U8UIM2_STECR|nr:hypothetical protein L596_000511 [Steinernema carpocapsae]